ncbi:MAG: DUF3822 family protein [Flavobacteriaceae bacterium]|nr:DUF3822 family protein [Bacteroidia bacterium]NNF73887.1 DUF3822 family protein [Flavobacteriaceae bacterium]NNK74247.1 DUF3822 family protein [Flavobacteriaceae bacterium]
METGQKITPQKNNIDELSSNILSIQVSLNGLSFCILDSDQGIIIHYSTLDFGKRLPPAEVLDNLKQHMNRDLQLQQTFRSLKVIFDNELSVLVPKPLFDEDQMANYLKFNSRIIKTDYLTFDELTSYDSVCVYIPFMNINNFLIDRFGAFEYRHYATILIDGLMAKTKNLLSKKMFVYVQSHHFEVIVLDKKSLLLYNTFEYKSPEDFIYYILFTAEQLRLNPEEIELTLFGDIQHGDDLFNMVYNYVRHVELMKPSSKFKLENEVNDHVLKNFVLINSF